MTITIDGKEISEERAVEVITSSIVKDTDFIDTVYTWDEMSQHIIQVLKDAANERSNHE